MRPFVPNARFENGHGNSILPKYPPSQGHGANSKVASQVVLPVDISNNPSSPPVVELHPAAPSVTTVAEGFTGQCSPARKGCTVYADSI